MHRVTTATHRIQPIFAVAFVAALTVSQAQASPVSFSSAVATFYQTFPDESGGTGGTPWLPSQMIDGITSGNNGWAVYSGSGTVSNAANSLLTLTTPLAAGSYNLTFTIIQNYGNTDHTVGDFSLGYTTAPSPTLSSPSTLFSGLSASSTDLLTTFTPQSGGKLLVGGDSPNTATYTILASISSASAITGIFFDVFNDPSLPFNGPGRQPTNGNFVVSEFTLNAAPVSAVPLPAALPLFATGLVGLGLLGWRRKKAAAG